MAGAAALAAVLAALRAPGLGILAAALLAAGALGGHLRLASLDAAAGLVHDGERVALRAELAHAAAAGALRLVGRGPGERRAAAGRAAASPCARVESAPGGSAARAGAGAERPARGAPGGRPRLRRVPAPPRRGRRAGAGASTRPPAAGAADCRVRSTGCECGPSGRCRRACRPARRALLRGMVLGEDEAIDPVTRDDFRASGLAHLLAVSGQNVMLLAALALPALMLWGVGPYARMAVLGGLIAVYVPLAGAGPSLQRAGLMGLAGLAAMAASRPASRSYAPPPRRGGHARLEPARRGRPRMAAVVRGRGRDPRPGRAPRGPPRPGRHGAHRAPARLAAAGAHALGRAPARRRGGGDRGGHARHRAAARAPLRVRPGRGPAGEPPGVAGGCAGHVAGDGQGGDRPGRAARRGRCARAAARRWRCATSAGSRSASPTCRAGGSRCGWRPAPAVAAAYAGMGLSLWAIRRAAGRPAAGAGGRLRELAARWRRLPRWRRHALLRRPGAGRGRRRRGRPRAGPGRPSTSPCASSTSGRATPR